MDEQIIRKIVIEELNNLFGTNDFVFQKNIQILNGKHISLGGSVGTIIGTSATQKLAFHGATPVIQADAITPPTGGVTEDTQARTAIGSIITALKNKGITA